ncbi:MAG: DUF4440 domain-containing protein [Planctomycetaceae bacterium]
MSKEVSQIIAERFKGLVAAAESLDTESYLAFFDSEKFTCLNEDGTVTATLSEFAAAYAEQTAMVESYESLEFSNVKVTALNESTAILINEYKAIVRLASGDLVTARGAGSQVWSDIDGDWKLVSVSSSLRHAEHEQN